VIERKVTITNPLGIHARPSALIVQTASRFKSEVFFIRDDLRVNGKSIMGVMMLAAEMGSEITIQAEGEDERECIEALQQAFQVRFDDE
jgi:phosphocarrier protein